MPRRGSVDRILDDVLLAIARHGVERVSMSDIAREAKVSRATLYRYFTDKDELLSALGERVREDFRETLEKAVAAEPDLRRRAHVIMDVHLRFVAERPALERLSDAEPGFTVAWFRTDRAHLREPTRDALLPIIGRRTAKQRHDLERMTDLIWRLSISYGLIPPADGESDPDWVGELLADYLEQYLP